MTENQMPSIFLPFDSKSATAIETLGLYWAYVAENFNCSRYRLPPPRLIKECPTGQAAFIKREYQASAQTLISAKLGHFNLLDPWTGDSHAALNSCTFASGELTSLMFLPLVYVLETKRGPVWAVTCGVTGRLMHLFISAINLHIYELSLDRAALIAEGIAKSSARILRQQERVRPKKHRVIGLIDMVDNYAHQMINHLSGIDEIIDQKLLSHFEEFWVCGAAFFGTIESLYPELKGRVIYLSRTKIRELLKDEFVLVLRVGSNIFFEKTRTRIMIAAKTTSNVSGCFERYPRIALTTRSKGRKCKNLASVVETVYKHFIKEYPSIGFVIDGWVFRQDQMVQRSYAATALSSQYTSRLRSELDESENLISKLPESALISNLIGASVLDSICGLMQTTCYLAHVGTLQHKVSFFSLTPGVVHGPRLQMENIEAGPFQANLGRAPTYLASSMIRDSLDSSTPHSDYEILDIDFVLRSLSPMI